MQQQEMQLQVQQQIPTILLYCTHYTRCRYSSSSRPRINSSSSSRDNSRFSSR
jgi:hypothetical protein